MGARSSTDPKVAHGNLGAWEQAYNRIWEEDGVQRCGNKDTTDLSVKRVEKDRERKATVEAKESRRLGKYMRKDDSTVARRAYNRHDKGILPNEISDDGPEELLNDLMSGFYQMKVAVTEEKAKEIEERTRNQAESEQWALERR